MKDQVVEMIQQAASGKVAVGVAVTTAATPAWISVVDGDGFRALCMIGGALTTIVIFVVNFLGVKYRSQQNRLDAALKRGQLKEMGINPDTI